MSKRDLYLLLSALFLAEVAAAFETSMVYAAMRVLIEEFGNPVSVGWMITTYGLVAAGSAAIAGRIGDIYGRREVILVLLIVASLGSVLSASTENYALVLVGRGLQGLAAAVLPLSIGIVRDEFPSKFVPIGIGILVSSAGAGVAAGFVLGGVIVDQASWRAMFMAAALLGLISVLGVLVFVPKSKVSEVTAKLDLVGGLLFAPGIAAVLFAITNAKDWGWSDPWVLISLFAGISTMIVWGKHSASHPNPLINIRLFANRHLVVACLVALLLALSGQQIMMISAILLQSPTWTGFGLGVMATVAGLVKLPSNILAIFAGPLTGWLASRYDNNKAMYFGGVCMTAGWLCLVFFHGNMYVIGTLMLFIAFGTTALFTATYNIVAHAVPKDRTSEATGILAVMRSTFHAIGAQLLAVTMATSTISNPEISAGSYPTATAMTLTLVLITGFSALCIASVWMLPRRGFNGQSSPSLQ